MVQRCCVPMCTSKVGDLDIYGIKVRFHRMPHTAEKFMQWCMEITDHRQYKPDPIISNNSRVCSKHFRKEDYLMKKPFGNNPLKPNAYPCIFKWNSACFETDADDENQQSKSGESEQEDESATAGDHQNSSKGTTLVYQDYLKIHREIQCSILDEKLVAEEVARKNSVIEQLLNRISLLEDEQKQMHTKLEELRAANLYYENQIRDINMRNQVLQQRSHSKAVAMAEASLSTTAKMNSNNNSTYNEDIGHRHQQQHHAYIDIGFKKFCSQNDTQNSYDINSSKPLCKKSRISYTNSSEFRY